MDDAVNELLPLWTGYFEGYRMVFLVTHSLGGIVSRKLCIRLHELRPDRLSSIRHIIMLAVPLSGSRWADLANAITFGANKKVEFLKHDNEHLHELRDTYEDMIGERRRAGLPTPGTSLYWAQDDKLVSRVRETLLTSLDQDCGDLPGDHSKVKEPKDINDPVVQTLAAVLREQYLVHVRETAAAKLSIRTVYEALAEADKPDKLLNVARLLDDELSKDPTSPSMKALKREFGTILLGPELDEPASNTAESVQRISTLAVGVIVLVALLYDEVLSLLSGLAG